MNTNPKPKHGTWQRYALKSDPCRQPCCREAARQRAAHFARLAAYGRRPVDSLVDATPAREHLAALRRDHGIGFKTAAELAGVSWSTTESIANGKQKRARRSSVDKIVAVRPDPARMRDLSTLDGTGTRRRLQALAVAGWTAAELGRHLGCTRENVRQLTVGEQGTLVAAATARAVSALYDALWNVTPPPPAHPSARGAVTRVRARAQALGWAPALAWDDDTIDDPSAQPDVGRDTPRSAADVAEEVEWIFAQHDPLATCDEIAHRLGYADHSGVQTALARAGRGDLLDLLNRNAEIAGHNVRRQTRKADAA